MLDYRNILKSKAGLPLSNYYESLWGKQLGGWAVTTLTGTLPITFRSNGTALINYRIYGTVEGAGVQTENLWNPNSKTTNQNGVVQPGVELPAGTYTIVNNSGRAVYTRDGISSTVASTWVASEKSATKTFDVGCVAWCTQSESNIVLVSGSTAPTTYIPYGYKLPLTVTSGTESKDTDIYIGDTKLLNTDYIDYETGKTVQGGTPQDPPLPFPEFETFEGTNTLDSTETLGEVTIKGKIKEAE